jgi:hypothetical protein
MPEKITSRHLARKAMLDVRESMGSLLGLAGKRGPCRVHVPRSFPSLFTLREFSKLHNTSECAGTS